MVGKQKARQASSPKDASITLRMTAEQRAQILEQIKGDCSITDHVLSKVFGGAARPNTDLRHVAALHVAGLGLHRLADNPNASKFEILAALYEVSQAIAKLAKRLP